MNCVRCPSGPIPLPSVILEVEGDDGARYGLCYPHWLEKDHTIEPTARKGGKPAMPIRAGSRTWGPQ